MALTFGPRLPTGMMGKSADWKARRAVLTDGGSVCDPAPTGHPAVLEWRAGRLDAPTPIDLMSASEMPAIAGEWARSARSGRTRCPHTPLKVAADRRFAPDRVWQPGAAQVSAKRSLARASRLIP